MRTISSRLVLLLVVALAAAAGAEAAPRASQDAPSLVLFSDQGFRGRQLFYTGGQTQAVQPGFVARSAVSSGVWTLCEGREATSRCQTVNGPAAQLKLGPRIVRAGVQAVALYDKPGLAGRRVIYSFASDRPPPFRVRSARTWGGPWSLCPVSRGRCETVDGARASLDLEIGAVRPGRAPERLQMALAAPPSQPPQAPASRPPAPAPRARTVTPPAGPARSEGASAPAALAQNDVGPPPRPPGPAPLAALPRTFPQASEPFAYVPPPPPQPAAPPAPPQPPPAGPTQVDYACADGRSLIVVFDPRTETAEILSQDADPVVLDRTDTPRGFRYESWNRAFYGDRGEATYEDRGGDPVGCRAVHPRRSAYRDP